MRGLVALVALTAAGASSVVTVGNERNASRAPGDQAEVAIAADPQDPNVLLGASGGLARTRTYTSTDGGKTWRSAADVPNTLLGDLPEGDPVPAIDNAGHQYLAFVAASPTTPAPYYALVTRDRPTDDWQPTNRPILDDRFQDKPMLAVDNAPDSPYPGRLYMGGVEFRIGRGLGTMVLTHSDDRGQTWSPPVTLTTGRDRTIPQFLTLAVGRGGVVYAGWMRGDGSLDVTQSLDGGETFSPFRVAVRLAAASGAWAVPAQTIPRRGNRRFATATPLLRVDTTTGTFADRVYLSFDNRRNGRTNVYVLRLTRDLRPIGRPVAVVRASRRADRFFPAIDVDETTGDLWDCFYATDGSRDLRRVRFSCSVSRDGGASWSAPVRAASRFSLVTRQTGDVTFGYGDYEGLAASGGSAHPMWTDSRARGGSEIWTATLAVR
jgi:BNR/Asp-box repeat